MTLLSGSLGDTARMIAHDGPAATVATCLLLKAGFLALHLLTLRLPECSFLERLALLHWSFDGWNVWCLAVFARTGRLPWSLETCVLYHVLGYLVYSVVYLHLQSREWTARHGEPYPMGDTPDSELTVRVSADDEAEDEVAATSDPFGSPDGGWVLSEDVPDDEREDTITPATAKTGRDALCAIPENEPGTVPPKEDSKVEADKKPTENGENEVKTNGERPTKSGSVIENGSEEKTKSGSGGPSEDCIRGPVEDSSSEPGGVQLSPTTNRPYRKLDAAGELLPGSPVSDAQCRDITEDIAAALKAGRRADGAERDADGTGFNKYSPVKTARIGPASGGGRVRFGLPCASEQDAEEGENDGEKGGERKRVGSDGGEGGDQKIEAGVNGDEKDHNGINGDQKRINGDHNGDHHGHDGVNGDRHSPGSDNGER
ncbi:hypothetical protein FJT64_027127 [Amphibalanus amphitrite]|uniref:Uncharacterized protein n=1 Tax=Amphibalanus amphitrite TaxID=1232801 RepID=A0A6A4W9F3_AMPAM|nr:hypothetical protein FJT64_027127 [Amphibalanus amphitrite]